MSGHVIPGTDLLGPRWLVRARTCGVLLGIDVLTAVLTPVLTDTDGPSGEGYRILLVSALFAAVLVAIVGGLNLRGRREPVPSAGLRPLLLLLTVVAFLQMLLTPLLLVLTSGSSAHGLVAALVTATVALAVLASAGVLAGRTWRAFGQAQRAGHG